MKAAQGTGGEVKVVDVAEPEGDGELIRVVAVSICASDLSYLRRGASFVAGHEIAGVTSSGENVVVEAVFGCGDCTACRAGTRNLCALGGRDILGLTVDGGMSEYFAAPRRALVPVPCGLTLENASLVEPGAVAWHACVRGGVGPGTRVAVVGAGAIGVLAALAAQRLGAAEVALQARYPYQQEVGERFGASTPGGLYDVVIEAAGSASALARAIELVAPRGTVATIGVYGGEVDWPYREAFLKEARIVPSMAYTDEAAGRDFEHVATLLAERPDIADTLITHRFGLDDAPEAFALAGRRAAGTYKIVVHP